LQRRLLFGEPAKNELADTQPLVPTALAKLRVRLGRTHPVAESYDVVRKEFNTLVNDIVDPLNDGESPEARLANCRERARVVRRALDDFTDKATRLGRIDPAVLAAAWNTRSSKEEREQT
jgi:hypothetical protein